MSLSACPTQPRCPRCNSILIYDDNRDNEGNIEQSYYHCESCFYAEPVSHQNNKVGSDENQNLERLLWQHGFEDEELDVLIDLTRAWLESHINRLLVEGGQEKALPVIDLLTLYLEKNSGVIKVEKLHNQTINAG